MRQDLGRRVLRSPGSTLIVFDRSKSRTEAEPTVGLRVGTDTVNLNRPSRMTIGRIIKSGFHIPVGVKLGFEISDNVGGPVLVKWNTGVWARTELVIGHAAMQRSIFEHVLF